MVAACAGLLACGALAGELLAGASAAAAGKGGPHAWVRVDQIGFQPDAAKGAYVLSKHDETGAPFSVRTLGGEVVLQGTVGSSLGFWSKRAGSVYALELGSLQTPGSYEIEVGGSVPASSPAFEVASPEQLFAAPLSRALSFYENERDGPDFIPSALRTAPGHLNDEHAMTYETPQVNEEGEFKGELTSLGKRINASGGWWDAGDYLKFVQTTSYTVAMQLAGVRDFPAEMGASAGASNFTNEARFGLQWLLRMWNDKTRTLYYQVGIGEGNSETYGDHDIWRLPQEDDTYGGTDPRYRFIRHRPVFRAGPPGSPVSPNLAGRDAAAFALCYQVFAASRPHLADRCLLAGEHIFELADTDPQGHLLTAIPWDFYPESEWRDDLELGATELSIALAGTSVPPAGLPHDEAAYYLRQAAEWSGSYIQHAGPEGEGLNLYDVSGLADYDLVRAMRLEHETSGLAVDEAQVLGDLAHKLEVADQQAEHDPFGFGFPWDAADTVSRGGGLSVMASEYDDLTGQNTYLLDSERWLGNVLGANAWGSSFIIGDGDVFPDCPQHQVANIVGSLDGGSPILAGAAVEGPSDERSSGNLEHMRPCPAGGGDAFKRFNNKAVYKDNVQSYTTTEPAIDLTASSMLAFSWQIAQSAPLP